MTEWSDMRTFETDPPDPGPPPLADDTLNRPRLGGDREACAVCGAGLASDQRYCLNCGTRRAEARLPFLQLLGPAREAVPPPAPAAPPPGRRRITAVAAGAGGAALVALGLLAGLLVGDEQAPAPRQEPPVVNITNTPPVAAAAAPTATPTAFTSDWPEGQEGWTVQLQRLEKASTTPDAVAAAKTAATTAGAPDVGALDTDAVEGPDAGAYLVYSGTYDTRADARDALRDLRDEFPDAEVVQIGTTAPAETDAEVQSDEELKAQQNRSPEEAQQEIRKAPDKLRSEGEAPPKDNKEPGGGTEATELE
jgi:hypothetical protein